ILDLLVDGRGVVERELGFARVGIVLRLLRHRERSGYGDLDPPARMGVQELDVADLHGVLAPDLADDARHRVRMAAAVERRAGVVDVDALERRREAVRVALAPYLAVRDDVEAGLLLRADRDDRGVVLRLLEPGRVHAP